MHLALFSIDTLWIQMMEISINSDDSKKIPNVVVLSQSIYFSSCVV
jgi:hypothetical protein